MRRPLYWMIVLAGCGARTETPPPVAAVPETDERLEVTIPWKAALLSDSEVVVSAQMGSGLAMVVDTAGRFLRTIGAPGEGPGEYRHAGLLAVHGDTILIFDAMRPMLHRFDRRGRPLRSMSTGEPITMEALRLRGDTIVLSQLTSSMPAGRNGLHLMSPAGRIVASFSASEGATRAFSLPMARVLAAENDSAFWAARRDRYVIERWNTAGVMEHRLVMRRDWFPALAATPASPTVAPPPTTIGAVHPDRQGRLVVLIFRAHPGWKPTPSVGGREASFDPVDASRWVERVVEVLDVRTGALLSIAVLPDSMPVEGFLADGRAFGFRIDGMGAQTPAFWRLTPLLLPSR